MNEPQDIHDDLVDDLDALALEDALDTLDWSDEELAFQDPNAEFEGFTGEIAEASARVETALLPIPRYPAPRPEMIKYEHAVRLAAKAHRFFAENPGEGARLFCLVSGNFILGDLLEAWCCAGGHKADELLIATLSLNQNNVDSLRNIIDAGQVDRLGIAVSAFWYAHNRRDAAGYMVEQLSAAPRYDFAAVSLHTKIILMRCGDEYNVLHGSANLCSSANIEQFMWERDRALYEFNREWLERVFSRFAFLKKHQTKRELWQTASGTAAG